MAAPDVVEVAVAVKWSWPATVESAAAGLPKVLWLGDGVEEGHEASAPEELGDWHGPVPRRRRSTTVGGANLRGRGRAARAERNERRVRWMVRCVRMETERSDALNKALPF
jgi:hypothetical protein